MKNQAYYDRLLNFDPNMPAVSEEQECHVEQQFRDSFAFRVFTLLGAGSFIGAIVYMAFFA